MEEICLLSVDAERGARCGAVRCGQLRVDIRNYVLQYLFQRAETLQQFVTTALVQLLCRVTKLGWFDYDAHHEIVEDVSKFLTATPAHYLVRACVRVYVQFVPRPLSLLPSLVRMRA